MFPTSQQFSIVLRSAVIGCIILLVNGCDTVVPDNFDHKEYAAAEVDRKAGTIFAPTVTSKDSIVVISNSTFTLSPVGPTNTFSLTKYASPVTFRENDTILFIQLGAIDSSASLSTALIGNRASKAVISFYYNSLDVNLRTLTRLVDSTTRANSTDNQIINSQFNLVIDSLKPLSYDTLLFLRYPDSQKISYAKISSDRTKDIYVYVSLFYNETNVSQYVDMEFVKSDTTLAASFVDMKEETASAGTDPTLYARSKVVVPIIRLRYRVTLSAGDYVVRFIVSDPLLLRGSDSGGSSQFKIFISSL